MMSRWRWSRLVAVAAVVALAGTAGANTAADYNAVGVDHYMAGNYQAAIDAFSQAYELAPRNKTIRGNLSNAYQAAAHSVAKSGEIRDIATGAQLLESAISLTPEKAAPLVQLGSYYLRLDYDQDAVFRLEEALQLDPDNPSAMELLGDAYYKSNDLVSAMEHWEQAIMADPSRAGVQEKIAKAERELSVEGEYRKTESRSRYFTITFAPGTRRHELTGVIRILDAARRDIGRSLGAYPDTQTQVIIYTAEDFTTATQAGEHVGALFDGKIRVPLDDRQGRKLPDDELKRRLYHEYVHVVVKYIAGNKVPWWLNEGLAETLSGELTEQDKARLAQAKEEGALFSLSTLEGSQLERLGPAELGLAYQQSHATVNYLVRRFGQRKMNDFLNVIADGAPAGEALIRVYRRRYAQIEREVEDSITTG